MWCKNVMIAIMFIAACDQVIVAQTPPPSQINLPEVIPPPADAGSLGKYGDVPVSMYTGSPDISVPLYSIKTPRLSLPITLNYNATGVKVDDVASWVGLEWSLNAGGVITRSIRGIDDFAQYGFYNTTLPQATFITNVNSWGYFQNYENHLQDNEPDYFFYNFSGYSGKFIFSPTHVPLIINYQQPFQIQYNNVPNGSFTILDEDGNTYYFNTPETLAQAGDYHGQTGPYYTSSWYLSKIVSFDRSDSITFTYTGDVQLEQDYATYSETIGPWWAPSDPDGGQPTLVPEASGHDGVGILQGEPFVRSNPWRLQEIDFKNGKAHFFMSATRKDGPSSKLDSIIVYNYNYESQAYNVIKEAKFSYDYYVTSGWSAAPPASTNAYRLRLDSVGITGAGNLYGGQYRFQYDNTILPWVNSNCKDLFGYYNGAIGNTSLVPLEQNITYSSTIYTVGQANRATDTAHLHAGILTKMIYPTGGSTVFTYQPNSYASAGFSTITPGGANAFGVTAETDTGTFVAATTTQAEVLGYITPYNYAGVDTIPYAKVTDLTSGQVVYANYLPSPTAGLTIIALINLAQGHSYQLVTGAFNNEQVRSSIVVSYQQANAGLTTVFGGGLRIGQLTDYDMNGRFLKSDLYTYGQNESGYGTLSAPTNLFNTNFYVTNFAYYASGITVPNPDEASFREIFTGSSIYDGFSLSGAPVAYSQVVKYNVDSLGNNLGKSVFTYNFYQDSIMPASAQYYGGFYLLNNGWQAGQLLSEQAFANKNGVYWPIRRTYHTFIQPALPSGQGLKIGFNYVYPSMPPLDSVDVAKNGNFMFMYYWFNYPIYTGSVLPSNTTEYDYDQNDTTKYVTSTEQMQYDNLTHLQPTTITRNLSDGSTLQTINRYPVEVDSINGLSTSEIAAIDSLQSRHNLTELIQTQTTRNNIPVSLLRHDYAIWPNNMILEDSIEWQESTFPIDKRIQFFQYDAYGNILQDAKALDFNHSYIWDYNSAYPIAEVSNALPSDIAYTSFEANGGGNWTVGSALRDTFALTGQQAYNLSNGACSHTGLTSSTIYVVSYWSNTGNSITVSNTTGIQKGEAVTINGHTWTYFEHAVTGTTSVSVSSTSSGDIDELRLYPSAAQMKTYTYSPLVGMSSVCDGQNRTTYYMYDGLGRLAYVKDLNGNIIKTYQYHFLGQPTQY